MIIYNLAKSDGSDMMRVLAPKSMNKWKNSIWEKYVSTVLATQLA